MSNINEINGRSRKGQFGHCPIRLEHAAFRSVYLRWNIRMKSEWWSTSSRCFRASECLASFTLTHWLHSEVPEMLLFSLSVTWKKGHDSSELLSSLQRNLSQPALESSGMEVPKPARKHRWLWEFAKRCPKYAFHKEFHSFLPILSANLLRLHFSDV